MSPQNRALGLMMVLMAAALLLGVAARTPDQVRLQEEFREG